jgi:hypothetical protein
MKRWYGEPVSCPDCEDLVIPEFYQGFWRIPEHQTGYDEPCGAYGERVIAR